MRSITETAAPDLTALGRQLQSEIGPKLRRFYEPTMREPVPSSFLRLIDDLQYADERPKRAARPTSQAAA
jgi:hypothetical protein